MCIYIYVYIHLCVYTYTLEQHAKSFKIQPRFVKKYE